MARTKRKVNPLRPQPTAAPQAKEFQTAAYIRLSIEDSRNLILAYIERQSDLRLVEVYCDNGHTGTNFKRPNFERMMEDVRRGKIDCIVVKDLSRFGRNYHETSNYLLRIFPFLGVRFVAVNDHFDTETAVETEYGLVMPLKNIINDTYSRDISRKISSAIETKERRGEFIGVYAPYGYSKSDDDRHKLVPNPETAPIIREIFALIRRPPRSYGRFLRSGCRAWAIRGSRGCSTGGVCRLQGHTCTSADSRNRRNTGMPSGPHGISRRSCGTRSILDT